LRHIEMMEVWIVAVTTRAKQVLHFFTLWTS
jgi:hypothetical protein